MAIENKLYRYIVGVISLTALFFLLWSLRSWNLTIGDGLFCCKQTVGEKAFPVTLSRSTLSLLLYRAMFFTLQPLTSWWVEDIIAISSCLAGLLFFAALYHLAQKTGRDLFEKIVFILFPSGTLLFQIFCGHIEFYSWLCAFLMLCAYLAWKSIYEGLNPVWPSAAMALSAGFHTSGVFYFPALLLIPLLMQRREGQPFQLSLVELKQLSIIFMLFIFIIVLHREFQFYRFAFLIALPLYLRYAPHSWRQFMKPWWPICMPWLILFTLRAFFGLRAEPLLEHVAPFREPYDHGAYLYMFFSWDHLFDKTLFHFWLAPFGLVFLFYFSLFFRRITFQNRWLVFLFNFCVWTMVWTIIFYNQLRDLDWYYSTVMAIPPRDWDLFASMAIPLNLFAVYAAARCLKPSLFRFAAVIAICTHLILSFPIIIDNSGITSDRGYVTLTFDTGDIIANAHVRQLKMGKTPLEIKNIRAGWAEIVIVPIEKGYRSWSIALELKPGETYDFSPRLKQID